MTSEVVVMNRVGVALAADSAATIEMGDSTKVRDSALKLFTLSKYRPVGVMIYHNTSLLGVPLETIIKLFRRDLRRKGFDTLGEYGEALIRFLDGNTSLFPEAVQDRYFLDALETEYRRIGELVEEELVARGLYGGEEGKLGDAGSEAVDGVIAKRLEFGGGRRTRTTSTASKPRKLWDGSRVRSTRLSTGRPWFGQWVARPSRTCTKSQGT